MWNARIILLWNFQWQLFVWNSFFPSPVAFSQSGRFRVVIGALPEVRLSTGFHSFSVGPWVLDDIKRCKTLSGCLRMTCLHKEREGWSKSILHKWAFGQPDFVIWIWIHFWGESTHLPGSQSDWSAVDTGHCERSVFKTLILFFKPKGLENGKPVICFLD